jgi:hypothetical protein
MLAVHWSQPEWLSPAFAEDGINMFKPQISEHRFNDEN